MSEYKINPKIDFVFRKLFGSDENKDLLISLINSVVEPELCLTDVIIKNPFNLATYQGLKESVLDIKAVDQGGVWYDIEMQVAAHILYGKRAIYYLSKLYSDQLEPGGNYSSLNTTIGIHFLDFDYFDDDRIVRHFVFKDAETNDAPVELDSLRLYFVEMSKFHKDWPEVRTALDRWIAFLNKAMDLEKLDLPVEMNQEPTIVKAVSELERIGLDPSARAIYEGEEKAFMIGKIELETAEKLGEKRGLQQGMQQGRQQGIQHVLLRQMARRFGEVPAHISARIATLSAEELEDLGLALFDFGSYADVEAWFTRH